MRCFQHFDREALGSCVGCGKGVCLDCLNKDQGRIYCGDCQMGLTGQAGHSGHSNQKQHRPGVSIQVHTSGGLPNLERMFSPPPSSTVVVNDKNRFFAALLAFCAGTFGVHKFYLDQSGMGFLYLLFCWTGLPTLAGFIEGVLYLTRSDQDFARRYGRTMLPMQTADNVLLSSSVNSLPSTPKEYERFLLQYASRHGGQISVARLMAEADLRLDKVEDALARLSAKGVVESQIDDRGHVKYYVPEFRD